MTTNKKGAATTAPLENEAEAIVPQNTEIIKQEADIDGFLVKRQEFIEKVNAICVEGKDYHVIQGKKSLAKGGAEKIASIFQWNAAFERDLESLEMLGATAGLVAFKCILRSGDQFVGEGRGAALLNKNSNDPNKTLKMAQKSAFIDAVLRSSGLSDFFTQDLEDHPEHLEPEKPKRQATEKQRELITKLMREKGYSVDDIDWNSTPSEVIDFLLKAPNRNTDQELATAAAEIDQGKA